MTRFDPFGVVPCKCKNAGGITMATEGAAPPSAEQGYSVRRIEGATFPLPPRSDEELATIREQHPDQAWFWTRAFYDSERQAEAEAEELAGQHCAVHYNTEEFQAFLESCPAADDSGDAHA